MVCSTFFFFNDTATTEIYTLSLHDALPISTMRRCAGSSCSTAVTPRPREGPARSEEHTSELQSQSNLVCRLLLEKKKKWQAPDLMYPPHRTHTACCLVTHQPRVAS